MSLRETSFKRTPYADRFLVDKARDGKMIGFHLLVPAYVTKTRGHWHLTEPHRFYRRKG